jgi:hypothetical protein
LLAPDAARKLICNTVLPREKDFSIRAAAADTEASYPFQYKIISRLSGLVIDMSPAYGKNYGYFNSFSTGETI